MCTFESGTSVSSCLNVAYICPLYVPLIRCMHLLAFLNYFSCWYCSVIFKIHLLVYFIFIVFFYTIIEYAGPSFCCTLAVVMAQFSQCGTNKGLFLFDQFNSCHSDSIIDESVVHPSCLAVTLHGRKQRVRVYKLLLTPSCCSLLLSPLSSLL